MAKGPDRPRAPQARNPAKHSKKDPAKPTRAKAARPDTPTLDPSLAELLNPGIAQGRAGIGAQTGIKSSPQRSPAPSPLVGEGREGGPKETTSFPQTPTPTPNPSPQERGEQDPGPRRERRTGLQQPPDNSWDRRADFAQAHR